MPKIDIDALNATVPMLPDDFEKWCQSELLTIPIYYHRNKKDADCICGKCANKFYVFMLPVKGEPATCPVCGHKGIWQWKKVVTSTWEEEYEMIIQKTTDNNLVIRRFVTTQIFQQGREAKIETTEYTRWFLKMGDVYRINLKTDWKDKTKYWSKGANYLPDKDSYLYPGYREVIKDSNLKYCDTDMIIDLMQYRDYLSRMRGNQIRNIMIAYANNPALEMYAKMGLVKLVQHLIGKDGKTSLINRRGKSYKAQLRLKDKQLINKLIAEKGDTRLLQVLQYEQKENVRYTVQQEEIIKALIDSYGMSTERTKFFLKYMTMIQLCNRITKYTKEKNSYGIHSTIIRYYDYLKMREELGYDMTNEVYIHPKNLIKKHAEMVKERNQRRDAERIVKKNTEFCEIAKNYKRLSKRFGYEEDGYFIRPAQNAGEIIVEGQTLHHCVGSSDTYMRRHNEGTSYILFLRKETEPDKPYYTIEIDKSGEIKQWYSLHDKKPDAEIIGALLERFVDQLKGKKKLKAAV